MQHPSECNQVKSDQVALDDRSIPDDEAEVIGEDSMDGLFSQESAIATFHTLSLGESTIATHAERTLCVSEVIVPVASHVRAEMTPSLLTPPCWRTDWRTPAPSWSSRRPPLLVLSPQLREGVRKINTRILIK
jgi:hypothetical protein